jgi:hypothetical protein
MYIILVYYYVIICKNYIKLHNNYAILHNTFLQFKASQVKFTTFQIFNFLNFQTQKFCVFGLCPAKRENYFLDLEIYNLFFYNHIFLYVNI